jgi:hypothetical protein
LDLGSVNGGRIQLKTPALSSWCSSQLLQFGSEPVPRTSSRLADRTRCAYCSSMKAVIATLLLLFQLQPLAGSAVCLLSSDRASKQDCEMPEQHTATHSSLLESGSPTQGCALASACAARALAAPSFSDGQESLTPLRSSSVFPASATLDGVVSAPPFHPPRA